MHRTIGPAIALAGALWLSAGVAFAGPPTEQLKGSIEQVIKILEDPGLRPEAMADRRRAAIRQVADQIFDFREAGRRTLGRHWQTVSEREREEFVALFAELLERSYTNRIEQYSGERITFLGDSVEQAGGLATVKTKFTTKKGTEIPVDYRMHLRGDRWRVYDVFVEGLSLIANYRSQFNKIIETASFQDLMNRLRAKTGEFAAPAAEPKKAAPKS